MASSNKNFGAVRKDFTMHKTTRIAKEMPMCGTVIPSYAEFRKNDKAKHENKYAMPKLNTLMSLKKEIDNIDLLQVRPLKRESDLSPRSKEAILPKVTQKLNFNVHRPVFKGLVGINVNDELLPTKTTNFKNKYIVTSKKIPAPDLSDFLDPLPPLEYVVPYPEIKLRLRDYKIDPLERYLQDSLQLNEE